MMFEEGQWIARRGSQLRFVHRVVRVEGEVLQVERHRVIAVYPEGEERLLVSRRGEERELRWPRMYEEVVL